MCILRLGSQKLGPNSLKMAFRQKNRRKGISYFKCFIVDACFILLMMSKDLLFAILFLSLISALTALDWQGYGNMSTSNLTDIWSYINGNIGTAVSTDTTDAYKTFTIGLSDHLNKLWDPAWNVVTVKTIAGIDTVLYGYAFRDHWLWYNGYTANSKVYSFVIWKDYNCQAWFMSTPDNVPNGFSTAHYNTIRTVTANVFNALGLTDIWKTSKSLIETLLTQSPFNLTSSAAYSIVASQGTIKNTFFYCQICLTNSAYYNGYMRVRSLSVGGQGRFLIFQTR